MTLSHVYACIGSWVSIPSILSCLANIASVALTQWPGEVVYYVYTSLPMSRQSLERLHSSHVFKVEVCSYTRIPSRPDVVA